MKKLILGALFIAGSIVGNAQVKTTAGVDYSLSDPYKVIDGSTKKYFSRDGEVLSVKIIGRKAFIQKFSDDKLNESARNEFELPKGILIEEFHEMGDHIYMFYSIYDRKNVSEQLFVREIDFGSAKFVDEGKLLMKTDGKVSGELKAMFSIFAMKVENKFDIFKSIDESRLVVQYRMIPKVKNDKKSFDKIGIHVFDQNMQNEWGGVYDMPYTERQMDNYSYTVDQKGNAHILAGVRNDPKTRGKAPADRLEIISISKGGKMENKKVELEGGKLISQIDFFDGGNDRLLISGFYSSFGKKGIEGIYTAFVTTDGEVENSKYHDIPVELVAKYLKAKKQKKMEKKDSKKQYALDNLYIRDVEFDSEGDVLITAEEYYMVETSTSTGVGPTMKMKNYYFQDILITKISKDGDLMWMDKLGKNQLRKVNSNFSIAHNIRGGLGFFQKTIGDYTYLLYMDNIKNLDLSSTEAPKRHIDGAGGYLTGYKIATKTGKSEKISVFNSRDVEGKELKQFQTKRIVELDDHSFAVEMYGRKKQDYMIKVTIE